MIWHYQLAIETNPYVGSAQRLASVALVGLLATWAFRSRSLVAMAAGILIGPLDVQGPEHQGAITRKLSRSEGTSHHI